MAKFCKKCGASMEDGDKFCTVCGVAMDMISQEETSQEEESQGASEYAQSQKKETKNARSGSAAQKTVDSVALEKEPLTFGNYLFLFLILAIPVVNIIVLLIWAFGRERNINRKNFSRAALIYVAAVSVLAIVILVGVFGKVAYDMIRYEDSLHHYIYEWDDDDWDVWTEATPFDKYGRHNICRP